MADEEKQQPLKLNLETLLSADRDEPEAEIVVVTSDRRLRSLEKKKKKQARDSSDASSSGGDDIARMSDDDLREQIGRMNGHYATMGRSLPDKGAKLKAQVQRLEEELERRKLRLSLEDANECKKPVHSGSSSFSGPLDGSKLAAPSSQPSTMSQFATSLMKKMEDDVKPKLEQNTGNQASAVFDHEISYLSRCNKQKRKPVGKLSQSKRAKSELCSKDFSAWKPRNCPPRNGRKYMHLNGNLAGRAGLISSLPLSEDKLAGAFTDKDGSQALNSNGSKNETVVLVDEEEAEVIEKKQEAEELHSRSDEGKIYYPSREDPESLEIFRSELKCLEPGEYLTSTIMNFYIRFLQELCSPADTSHHNFYFFNTYFYSKLQEAVAYQKSDKEAFFIKFRRWWKGVNIFQKAYIFLPINEEIHWSLVIICIPDEEDESGPIILHLDSLGWHSSSVIFENIKSLLRNEWKFINEDGRPVAIPIHDRIWKNLPRRIDQRIITVPRQTNDYDCGLFVLYYIERFIQEAPQRLKRQHLSMFGKNWFKPKEASSLRVKIKRILQEEFHKALRNDNSTWEPVCLSAHAKAANATDRIEIS